MTRPDTIAGNSALPRRAARLRGPVDRRSKRAVPMSIALSRLLCLVSKQCPLLPERNLVTMPVPTPASKCDVVTGLGFNQYMRWGHEYR